MLRGMVVSAEPGKEVVILVFGTGEQRRIPWADVEKLDRGKHARVELLPPPPPPPPAAPPAGAPAPTAPAPAPGSAPDGLPQPPRPGVVRLHVDADNPGVDLFQVTASGVVVGANVSALISVSRKVCTAPCDRVIDGSDGGDFFFGGNGVTPSRSFRLDDRSGDVTAHTEARSSGARKAGMWLTIIGGGLVVTGASLLIGEALTSSASSLDDAPSSASPFGPLGGAALGLGGAAMIPGIILLATSGTKLTLGPVRGPMDTALLRF
ncbi:hypothetical protein [Chondromyces apiculatus]|uniref:Uncharacterized protein n=1 Tax=Chondromyces apiculatus DSM 436 TaxID=1192034 RepID=A0A017SWG9_9BACT|nr:hypothetical protein [Chondromyces apiculatus]EYF00651.1 Hypothetical protein CAP_0404 [Chondromyces apiculatus DSM 436]